jgi:hypothetical protein
MRKDAARDAERCVKMRKDAEEMRKDATKDAARDAERCVKMRLEMRKDAAKDAARDAAKMQ